MRRLIAADLLPERAGQPVKVWAHISLADLLMLDGSSALQQQWTTGVRAQWAAHRAAASVGGGDGGAWLEGDAARAFACDASVAPVVIGEVNYPVLDDLVRLCAELGRLNHTEVGGLPGRQASATDPSAPRGARAADHRQGRGSPVGARRAWPPFPAPPTARCPAGRSRACLWMSGTARPFRPGSGTLVILRDSTASGRDAVTSPLRRVKCTTSSTSPRAARPA